MTAAIISIIRRTYLSVPNRWSYRRSGIPRHIDAPERRLTVEALDLMKA